MHVFAFTLLLASAVASATDLSGNYTVSGKNPGGAAYSGKLSVRAEGVAYRLSWDTGSNLSGLAVPAGNMLVASFGAGCGVVAYQKASGGVLNGTWIAEGIGAGTEQAAPGAGVRRQRSPVQRSASDCNEWSAAAIVVEDRNQF